MCKRTKAFGPPEFIKSKFSRMHHSRTPCLLGKCWHFGLKMRQLQVRGVTRDWPYFFFHTEFGRSLCPSFLREPAIGPAFYCINDKEGESSRCLFRESRKRRGRFRYGFLRYIFIITHEVPLYRGTSLMRAPPPVGPYSSPMPKALW